MTLKTVTVTGQIYNPDGTPAAGVEGYATLNRPETDNGIVIPTSTFIKADADGRFSIQLWPNARGSGQSQYIVKAYTRRASVLNLVIMVPDVDVPVVITDIAIVPPYPPIDQSLQALLDVQAASVIAQAAKVEALEAEAGALASAQSAAGSATSAGQSAQTAETKAQEASTSAQAASASEDAAALSEEHAEQAKDGAVTARNKAGQWAENPVDTEVEPGQFSAKHHAIKARQSEQTASTKAGEALQSQEAAALSASNAASNALSANEDRIAAQQAATSASGSATTASTQAGIASTQAGIASTKAGEASTSATNAATSEGKALEYKNTAETAKTDVQSARDKAAQWAEKPTDEEVESGQYSAKHHASKAADSADEAAASLQEAQDLVIGLSSYAIPGQVVKTTPGGQTTYLFRQPAFNLEDVAPGGELGTGLFPAFVFNGIPEREIFVGAYPAAMVNGEVVCQPGRDPATSINFDNARAACQALGTGWDIMSNWDWVAIALWCLANGFEPRGNTDYGRHDTSRWETGTRVVDDVPGSNTNSNGRTLTGSGPASWAHNNTPGGIHDLVGNVWEWNQGMILDNNIFKVAPDNGTYLESEFIDTEYAAAANGTFATRPYTDPPLILKQALAVPASAGLAPTGYFYKNAEGLRFAIRGGSWFYGSLAGLGALYFIYLRSNASTYLGFRPRFRNL